MKPISIYEGYYSITNNGKIWSNKRIINSRNQHGSCDSKLGGYWLSVIKGNHGYNYCILSKNGKCKLYLVHRLVAQAFIPNLENKPYINHLNGIKTDNRVENLEWVTRQENSDHAWKIGLFDNRDQRGGKNGMSKLTQEQVREIRTNHISKGVYTRKPWDKYGICQSQYHRVLNNTSWKGSD